MAGNLILVDTGNTTMKICVAAGGRRTSYSLRTDPGQTPDSLGFALLQILAHAGCDPRSVEACLAGSVVPAADPLLRRAVTRFVGAPVLFSPADLPVPLENRYFRAEQVGADRLLAAWGARLLFPDAPGLVVVDFGTAVTFDCVERGAYLGGLIFPGPSTALGALTGAAARLPAVSLDCEDDRPAPCRDTETSIRHGILFGFAAMVDGLTARLSEDLPKPVQVVATGGFARTIARVSRSLTAVRDGLTLLALENLYESRRP